MALKMTVRRKFVAGVLLLAASFVFRVVRGPLRMDLRGEGVPQGSYLCEWTFKAHVYGGWPWQQVQLVKGEVYGSSRRKLNADALIKMFGSDRLSHGKSAARGGFSDQVGSRTTIQIQYRTPSGEVRLAERQFMCVRT